MFVCLLLSWFVVVSCFVGVFVCGASKFTACVTDALINYGNTLLLEGVQSGKQCLKEPFGVGFISVL